ncbi:Adenosine receptor A1 [Collichthys lucidus]|uniref:Adenosine receptor A1 n=1 Tax=Collichthys lucidus TaxID=240159 RepID=A0A4U5V3L6_COLLU|nr:Adenosine receptor A1 [Collichthys lucidus]
MEIMWLYSLCECIISACVIVVSVRLCLAVSRSGTASDVQVRTQGARTKAGSVSCCLQLCLGWVGAVGGAVTVPVTVLLNLRTPQCLYTCITLVCCPMLVRQFTMFLLMLLTLDAHLQLHLADSLSAWMLSTSGEEMGPDPGTAGHGLHGNWTTSLPNTTPLAPKYHHDRKVIGKYLPYGGFLSKFYVEDNHNFTYAEIHSSHWGVCAPDTILSPQFLVYVHGMMGFIFPLVFLLSIYLDLLCIKPRKTHFSNTDPPKNDSCQARSLALSLSLLVLLCLPLHIIHALALFTPSTPLPAWAHAVALFLYQLYSIMPQILFTPPKKKEEEQTPFPLSVPHLPPAVAVPSRGKSVRMALCEAVQASPWSSAKHSLKAKVCPEV